MQRILTFLGNSPRVPLQSNDSRFVCLGRSLVPFFWMWTTFACNPALPAPPTFPIPFDETALSIATPPGLAEDPPPSSIILPGDVMRLQIISSATYQPVELLVDTLGRVHVPLGGDVDVMGLSLAEAEKRVEESICQYDKFARANLSVQAFSGHRVIVNGAVDKPGVYEARPGFRIADVVALAGGTRILVASGDTQEASDLEAARIVRSGKTLPVSVKLALVGEPLHNVYVRPGDIIFIPWSLKRQIPVLGDVRAARNVPYHRGIRLTEALAAAGGPARTADMADVRIIRGPLSHAKVYRANLDKVIAGAKTDIELAPGDVVFVTEHWFATATDVLNRLTPLLAAAALYSAIAPRPSE